MTEIVWRGPDQIRPLLVPLSSIQPWPDNPRDGDLGAIAASLARFGQQRPIVVQRSSGFIVAGNHVWRAAAMAGELERTLGFGDGLDWTHVAAVFTDLSGDEAKGYLIADNRTHDLGGGYNDAKLAALLAELAAGGSLVGVGYDGDDVDRLLAELANASGDAVDKNAEWTGMPEFEHEDQESWRAVVVHFREQADLDDFLGRLPGAALMPGRSAMWWPPAERIRLADKQWKGDEPTEPGTLGRRR